MKYQDHLKKAPPRDLLAEARDMVKDLKMSQRYELYDVVIGKQKYSQPAERRRELEAVQRTIENWPGIDQSRLHGIRRGIQSEMARQARPGR